MVGEDLIGLGHTRVGIVGGGFAEDSLFFELDDQVTDGVLIEVSLRGELAIAFCAADAPGILCGAEHGAVQNLTGQGEGVLDIANGPDLPGFHHTHCGYSTNSGYRTR